jgi:hypothetical protein
MSDKSVSQYKGLSSILVSNLWWARNSSLFRDKDIPPKITTGITLNLAETFKAELKTKNPKNPVMPELDF